MGAEYSTCTAARPCGYEDTRNFVPGRKCGIGGNRLFQEVVDCVTYGSKDRLESLVKNVLEKNGAPVLSRKELFGIRTVKGKSLLHVACEGITFREHKRTFDAGDGLHTETVRVLGTESDNYLALVHYLIENKADINARDNKNCTPLDTLFPLGHESRKRNLGNVQICVELVELMYVLGFPINDLFEDGSSLLHVACRNADFSSLELLIDRLGAGGNNPNAAGDRPLQFCVQDEPKYRKVTQKLLMLPDIEVNLRGSGFGGVSKQYILIQAICLGHNDSACLLLERGADPNVRYFDLDSGMPLQTALFLACFQHRNKALMRVNRPGANYVNSKALHFDSQGCEELHIGGKGGVCVPSLSWTPSWQLCLIDRLLRLGADPNALDVGDEKDCIGTNLMQKRRILDQLAQAKEKGRTVLQRLYTASQDQDPIACQIDAAIISVLSDAVYTSHTRANATNRANWPTSQRRLSKAVL